MIGARSRQAAVFVLLLGLLWTGSASAQGKKSAKQTLTLEDVWKVKRLGKPSLSPDGKWAVVEVTTHNMDQNEAASDLWLLATDGSTQRQLTTHPARDSGPVWSPD